VPCTVLPRMVKPPGYSPKYAFSSSQFTFRSLFTSLYRSTGTVLQSTPSDCLLLLLCCLTWVVSPIFSLSFWAIEDHKKSVIVNTGSSKVFAWFANMSSVSGMFNWLGICITAIRFRAGLKVRSRYGLAVRLRLNMYVFRLKVLNPRPCHGIHRCSLMQRGGVACELHTILSHVASILIVRIYDQVDHSDHLVC
jgi:Amino acid permease